jgi:hypothetical protein
LLATCDLFISVSEVGRFCGFANRYRVPVVAESDLILALATSLPFFREGHGYHEQHA